ncbi:MAG TPA: Spy/CpxP family protein refolding chaperone [Ramlibacter sp.]|nr:Spy/CpxP family protein refolding chaperone [Ramlibacter sp.]
MKPHLRKHLITCALLAGLGAGAHAQTPPPASPGAGAPHAQGRHFDPARMAARVNQRLEDLKQKLQLSPGQESAWSSFANAMRPNPNRQRPDREAIARMATPDRIDHMRALRNERIAEMDRRADATKAFYNQLTAEQKKTFDAETARRGHGKRHHG